MSSRRAAAATAAAAGGRDKKKGNDGRWQQRSDLLPEDRISEFETFPMVTAKDLRTHKQRPRRVKMLLRDFIEGECLGGRWEGGEEELFTGPQEAS